MKKILLLLSFCLMGAMSFAQTPGRFTLKATMTDSSGVGLPEATVMLLMPKDSSLVNFGRTNKEGMFELKNIKSATYLLKVTYVGYVPFQKEVKPTTDVLDLGKVSMSAMDKDLYEVVIKAFRAPMNIRGDTIEYDPKAFKVQPGANVEDLIRRIPGLQVDADGNIKAQGEAVSRVTVDGKRFFGDDPKSATRNLPAEAINKIQVFNGKSEQSKATGIDDGKREKTLNLELKDSHKKGGFGKAVGGVGTDSRLEGKGSYNRFSDKQQFAVLGFGNNSNQSGIGQGDYQDFKGSQSFNWGDDGDFGFGGGRSFGGDDVAIGPDYGGGGSNQGFTKNFAGGLNYNYDTKKTKLSTSYFYNRTNSNTETRSSTENFLTGGSYRSQNKSNSLGFVGNHRPSIRFEKVIDSLNSIVVISNTRINGGDTEYRNSQQSFRNENGLTNQSTVNNTSKYNSFAMSNLLLYRHKFNKKGRNFAASAGININNTDGENNQNSINEFFSDSTRTVQVNQRNESVSERTQFKGSLSFVEPFAKKFFWETFYNFSLRKDLVDKDVFDVRENKTEIANDFLTRYYTNDFMYNRLGTSIRYSYKGLNINAGLAGQQFDLSGRFARDQNSATFTTVNRTFFTFVPNVGLNYDLKKNRYLWGQYGMYVREPSVTDLQPVVDNSNPLYITEGNPNLLPSSNHNANLGYNMFNPGTFMNLYANINYSYYVNQIVYNQTINPETLVKTTKPTNITGGNNYGTYLGFGFPIKKTKVTMNLNTGANFSRNLTYINDVVNETNGKNYNFGARLDITPSDKFTLYTNANWSVNNTEFSINKAQNQKVINANYNADMNIKMPFDIYFNSRFTYKTYTNSQFGFNQKQPILNMSVYKIVLKNKRGEVRLTANDVFKKNLGISQYASQNFYTESRVTTLSRYFMLSFTYNMRGMSASVKRSNNFF